MVIIKLVKSIYIISAIAAFGPVESFDIGSTLSQVAKLATGGPGGGGQSAMSDLVCDASQMYQTVDRQALGHGGKELTPAQVGQGVVQAMREVPPNNNQISGYIMTFAAMTGVGYCSQHQQAEYMSNAANLARVLGINQYYYSNFQILKWYGVRNGAYLAYLPAAGSLVLVYRGTIMQKKDVQGDLDAQPASPLTDPRLQRMFPIPAQGQCTIDPQRTNTGNFYTFKGFTDNLLEGPTFLPTLLQDLSSAYAKFGANVKLIITGHSLGGAKAVLTALFLTLQRNQGQRLPTVGAVYTYGQPIVGSLLFENWASLCIGPNSLIRVVNGQDIVPWLRFRRGSIQHSTLSSEFYFPGSGQPLQRCNAGNGCSASTSCTDKSWNSHNFVLSFPLESICKLAPKSAAFEPEDRPNQNDGSAPVKKDDYTKLLDKTQDSGNVVIDTAQKVASKFGGFGNLANKFGSMFK